MGESQEAQDRRRVTVHQGKGRVAVRSGIITGKGYKG